MGTQRILVVDDSAVNQRLFRALLADTGYHVECASDSAQAMAAVGHFAPDLVIVDVRLAGADGLDLARELRSAPGKRMAIVAVTSAENDHDAARARESGCDAYMARPVELRALRQLIAAHLGAGVQDP